MPGLNGVDMVKQLRLTSELNDVPILVLTAMGQAEMEQAIAAGANRAMAKPVLLDALADDVRELLLESDRRRE
jgi:CheY-like chemotaxis protein